MTSELLARVRLAMYDAHDPGAAPDVGRMMAIWRAHARFAPYDARCIARDCIRGYLGGGDVPLWELLGRGWIDFNEALHHAHAHPAHAAWLADRLALGVEAVRWGGPAVLEAHPALRGHMRAVLWARLLATSRVLVEALPARCEHHRALLAQLSAYAVGDTLVMLRHDDAYAVELFRSCEALAEHLMGTYHGMCCWVWAMEDAVASPHASHDVPVGMIEYHAGRLLVRMFRWAMVSTSPHDRLYGFCGRPEAERIAWAMDEVARGALYVERLAARDGRLRLDEAHVASRMQADARVWLCDGLRAFSDARAAQRDAA